MARSLPPRRQRWAVGGKKRAPNPCAGVWVSGHPLPHSQPSSRPCRNHAALPVLRCHWGKGAGPRGSPLSGCWVPGGQRQLLCVGFQRGETSSSRRQALPGSPRLAPPPPASYLPRTGAAAPSHSARQAPSAPHVPCLASNPRRRQPQRRCRQHGRARGLAGWQRRRQQPWQRCWTTAGAAGVAAAAGGGARVRPQRAVVCRGCRHPRPDARGDICGWPGAPGHSRWGSREDPQGAWVGFRVGGGCLLRESSMLLN